MYFVWGEGIRDFFLIFFGFFAGKGGHKIYRMPRIFKLCPHDKSFLY